MASLIDRIALVWLASLTGCDDLAGFGGTPPPLVSFQVAVTGDPATVAGAELHAPRIGLIWGDQWLTEPICILPPESPEVAAVLAAGCRDPFGFVPRRVTASAPLVSGAPTAVDLFDLPDPDVMIGDVTARITYGSFVLFDDVDDSGILELDRPRRPNNGDDMGPPDEEEDRVLDVVYGASFVTMTAPDQRASFREGLFNSIAAFYPRAGCGVPPPGFSILSAGGFTAEAALAASLRGELPLEDPETCSERAVADTVVTFPVRPPAEVREVACDERRNDSSIRYREPPADASDFTDRQTICAKLADFGGGEGDGVIQLLVTGRSTDTCKSLSHYVLKGCREDALCALPDWDLSAHPPAWWPCPTQAAR